MAQVPAHADFVAYLGDKPTVFVPRVDDTPPVLEITGPTGTFTSEGDATAVGGGRWGDRWQFVPAVPFTAPGVHRFNFFDDGDVNTSYVFEVLDHTNPKDH